MNDVLYGRATDLMDEYNPKDVQVTADKARDEALSLLATTVGWKELKKIIELYIESLDSLNIADTDTVETVGYKYLASKTAKTYLQSVIEIVEQTNESIREEREARESSESGI